MRWMLDTDTCIAIIKRQPESALRRLSGKSIGQVGISSVTLGELAFGAAKSSSPEQSASALREFLLPLEIASFDEPAAWRYGVVRRELERRGQPIGPLDTLIASHALTLDAVLVTHNAREFSRVAGLTCEDWIRERRRHDE
jgi:tRNA(fMet)-specific endonuclease VapC